MSESGRHAVGRAWLLYRALPALVAVAGGAAIAAATMTTLVARVVVTPPRKRSDDTRILAVDLDGATITLSRTADTSLPGRYGLWTDRDTGHLKLGEIVSSTPTTVTRHLDGIDLGQPERAAGGRFSGWYHVTPDDIDLPWRSVEVETELGAAPAWLIPAASDPAVDTAAVDPVGDTAAIGRGRWAILVHGRGVSRAEALRAVPVLHGRGFTCLVVSWRNDGDAPPSPDGRYGLGATEWNDVDAALGFARDHGARDVVLVGWSMGGAISLQAARNSPHAPLIRGIVLESPVVAWAPTLDFQAQGMRIPPAIRRASVALLSTPSLAAIAGQSTAVDFASLDFVERASEITVPILLMHSDDDGFVPIEASEALARARPDIVDFHRWTDARHAKLWNFDPERFDREIGEWVDRILPA
ncbi:alpha/beta hydrolase [Marisediminicola sp. LYQ85]|uniref:alpha/beta hydrolase n=1 Tax=Marisediminicola sp. LYQ85 TaxID=3391062 RepID=UPI003982F6F8